ncbi:hypothetical protein, partial [Salmonella enterica]|uniref:hypothetical protein n=1 Tax=Salmonella enterica TaxID=28901 RepID=UPI003CF60F18
MDLSFTESPVRHPVQGHAISWRFDPSREDFLRALNLHALVVGSVESRPLCASRKDVVREHVDVLP